MKPSINIQRFNQQNKEWNHAMFPAIEIKKLKPKPIPEPPCAPEMPVRRLERK